MQILVLLAEEKRHNNRDITLLTVTLLTIKYFY